MGNDDNKKYTITAKRGIKGEAFFESLIADYSLPFHVTGLTDLGVDYFCEWVHGENPTGILYAVQVKTFSEETAKPKYVRVEKGHNGLETFEIKNSNLRMNMRTLHYWKGLGIPIYLFAIVESASSDGKAKMDCYYKRYSPVITGNIEELSANYHELFYKANDGPKFLAYQNFDKKSGGFTRDLFIDCIRLSYVKGVIAPQLNPRNIGLSTFAEAPVFFDLFKKYKKEILNAHKQTNEILEKLKQQSSE